MGKITVVCKDRRMKGQLEFWKKVQELLDEGYKFKVEDIRKEDGFRMNNFIGVCLIKEEVFEVEKVEKKAPKKKAPKKKKVATKSDK